MKLCFRHGRLCDHGQYYFRAYALLELFTGYFRRCCSHMINLTRSYGLGLCLDTAQVKMAITGSGNERGAYMSVSGSHGYCLKQQFNKKIIEHCIARRPARLDRDASQQCEWQEKQYILL